MTNQEILNQSLDKIIECVLDENIKIIATRMRTDYEFCISLLGFCTTLAILDPFFLKELNKQYLMLKLTIKIQDEKQH